MAKIDLDSMSIEELATLRDNAAAKLLEKVAARQVELEAEIDRLSQYGKPGKKPLPAAPAVKTRKGEKSEKGEKGEKKADETNQPSEPPVAEAA